LRGEFRTEDQDSRCQERSGRPLPAS
jgi:hypothetical protein